jgi:hypothetical protein
MGCTIVTGESPSLDVSSSNAMIVAIDLVASMTK